jgi:hypothetical protein
MGVEWRWPAPAAVVLVACHLGAPSVRAERKIISGADEIGLQFGDLVSECPERTIDGVVCDKCHDADVRKLTGRACRRRQLHCAVAGLSFRRSERRILSKTGRTTNTPQACPASSVAA